MGYSSGCPDLAGKVIDLEILHSFRGTRGITGGLKAGALQKLEDGNLLAADRKSALIRQHISTQRLSNG